MLILIYRNFAQVLYSIYIHVKRRTIPFILVIKKHKEYLKEERRLRAKLHNRIHKSGRVKKLREIELAIRLPIIPNENSKLACTLLVNLENCYKLPVITLSGHYICGNTTRSPRYIPFQSFLLFRWKFNPSPYIYIYIYTSLRVSAGTSSRFSFKTFIRVELRSTTRQTTSRVRLRTMLPFYHRWVSPRLPAFNSSKRIKASFN